MELYLVPCVSLKLNVPAPARELYVSPLFRKARAYVLQQKRPWFILSAKYGLVHPDQVIDPYDLTLKSMGTADRWAEGVMSQIRPRLTGITSVVFLAGQKYREFLEPQFTQLGITVQVPMKGLSIGRQLSWLDRQIHERPACRY
jgi:cytoplasmic iron level regulating protein YaaA (DUF328/UPF0246 family)